MSTGDPCPECGREMHRSGRSRYCPDVACSIGRIDDPLRDPEPEEREGRDCREYCGHPRLPGLRCYLCTQPAPKEDAE